MPQDELPWLDNTRIITKVFIERHYPNEILLFDIFWETFLSRMHILHSQSSDDWSTPDIVTNISFAAGNTLDFVTPIVLATLSETLHNINQNKLSTLELDKLIGQSADRYGAKPGLAATLIRHVSALCMELLAVKEGEDEAIVSIAHKPMYRIWSKGISKIVDDISKYEKDRNNYLFWIDLDSHIHISPLKTTRKLRPMAIKLLRCLIDHIGFRLSFEQLLDEVYGDTSDTTTIPDTGLIGQYLTELHKFCGDRFREYLFTEWKQKGLGLKVSFKPSYFLYERLEKPAKSSS